jgi:hypothetical protein
MAWDKKEEARRPHGSWIEHDDPALGAMDNFQEQVQELSLRKERRKEGCIAVKTAKESSSQSAASPPGLGPWVLGRVVERASPLCNL